MEHLQQDVMENNGSSMKIRKLINKILGRKKVTVDGKGIICPWCSNETHLHNCHHNPFKLKTQIDILRDQVRETIESVEVSETMKLIAIDRFNDLKKDIKDIKEYCDSEAVAYQPLSKMVNNALSRANLYGEGGVVRTVLKGKKMSWPGDGISNIHVQALLDGCAKKEGVKNYHFTINLVEGELELTNKE